MAGCITLLHELLRNEGLTYTHYGIAIAGLYALHVQNYILLAGAQTPRVINPVSPHNITTGKRVTTTDLIGFYASVWCWAREYLNILTAISIFM